MREHPDVARLVAQFRADGVPTYDAVGVIKARAILENVSRMQGPPVSVARVEDLLVDGAAGLLPARIYHPDPARALPVVVYLHGGGWALGSVRAADRPCRALAAASGCAVVSVEYRRAPETRFPGPLLDCVTAVRSVAARAAELNGDPERIVVMGDSAGGNLAAATALSLRDAGGPPLAAQILLYPCLLPTGTSSFASLSDQADGPLMTRRELNWFWDLYVGSGGETTDPRAAPLLEDDLTGLPPAAIVLAELDPLRDEGLAYAERLEQAGVPVTTTIVPGAAHGFWWMDAEMEQAGELTNRLAEQLRLFTA